MSFVDVYINVITLNCWGIPYVSKNRIQRIDAIATYLSKGKHDIVSLQEVWDEKDYLTIKQKVINVLPFSHYFYSGVWGSGVCVFSKWPIEDVFFHAWALNGYVHMVHHGDWFGGKGVGLCKIKYNDLIIHLYSAHLHAEYNTHDIYLAHRTLQAFDTAEFIKFTSSSADVVILAGDLNTQSHDLAYKMICEIGNLFDSFTKTDDIVLSKKLGTNERAENTYTDPTEAARFPEGKRIDYILYNSRNNYKVNVVEYDLPISGLVPGHIFSYSDHDAVSTKLSVSKCLSCEKQDINVEEYKKTLKNGIDICHDALSSLQYSRRQYFIYAASIFLLIISTIGRAETTVLDMPRLLLVAIFFYFIFMGTLWNCMEWNGVFSGLKSLEVILSHLN